MISRNELVVKATFNWCKKALKKKPGKKPILVDGKRRDHEMFRRVVIEGEKVASVAMEFNVKDGTVTKAIQRVFQKLRELDPLPSSEKNTA